MEIDVNVTHDDIDEGREWSHARCPIARAIQRTVGGRADKVIVRTLQVDLWLEDEPTHKCAGFPYEVTQFINDFDAGDPVSPIQFSLKFV